jgi:hypothetical protein
MQALMIDDRRDKEGNEQSHCSVTNLEPGNRVTPIPAPKDLPERGVLPQRRLSFRREWTLPTRISNPECSLSVWDDGEYAELIDRLMPPETDAGVIHRCGGHPQEIQGEMRLECQLVTNGIYCGASSRYNDPRRTVLATRAADWQLLLQIDSDEKRMGWMWGDSGRVYFWARRQDIASARFDHAWEILPCY